MEINFKGTKVSQRKWHGLTHDIHNGRKNIDIFGRDPISTELQHITEVKVKEPLIPNGYVASGNRKFKDKFCSIIFLVNIIVFIGSAIWVYSRASQATDYTAISMNPSEIKTIFAEFCAEFKKPFGLMLVVALTLGIVWIFGLLKFAKAVMFITVLTILSLTAIGSYFMYNFSMRSDGEDMSEFQQVV